MKTVAKQIFTSLLEVKHIDSLVWEELIHPEYSQWVNGSQLNYSTFKNHILTLRKEIKSCQVIFNTLIEEDDKVFSNHTVHLEMNDGGSVKFLVLADLTFRDGKLYACSELTFQLQGNHSHNDLGSRV